jgi:hypothetical protein
MSRFMQNRLPEASPPRSSRWKRWGAENLLSFAIGGQDFKIRAPTQDSDRFVGAVDQTVHLRPAPEWIYLFDPDSGATCAQAAATDRKGGTV